MKVLGYVNRFNRGIQSVQEELNENGNGNAIFDFDKMTVFGVTVYNAVVLFQDQAKDEKEKVVEKVVENITENQRSILIQLAKNPYTSAKALAATIGISSRKIQDNMKKLKDMGYIKRIGPAKGGHWEIINER